MQANFTNASIIETLRANEITLLTGNDAFELFSKESFQTNWDVLYQACPWATAFQSRAFVTTWYQTYKEKYLPIIVKGMDGDKLTGLLTLAMTRTGLIVGAGEEQAEYQVWLATYNNGGVFIKKALLEIHKFFIGKKIYLKYIPANALMKWVEEDPVLKKICTLRFFKQPLMKVDEAHIMNELRKKNRREKINRLKKMGDLKFEHITNKEIFTSILDQLALQYDFRLMAMYNTAFFQNDRLRKKFLLSLFEQDILHVTILRLNEKIIASNVGTLGKSCVHLKGLNTYDPSYAKYSPGILHFLMLGKQLADEGIEVFDLTPGGDYYKDKLATDYSLVYTLSLSSIYSHIADTIKLSILEHSKRTALKVGFNLATLKVAKKKALILREKIGDVKMQKLYFWIKNFLAQILYSGKSITYIAKSVNLVQLTETSLNKNSLDDLLNFDAEGTWMTRWEFLENAMRRLEVGQSFYTFCEGKRLLFCAWLSTDAQSTKAGSHLRFPIEAEAPLLQGFYYHPEGLNKLKAFVGAVASAAIMDKSKTTVYAITTSKDKILSQTLKAVGFEKTTD